MTLSLHDNLIPNQAKIVYMHLEKAEEKQKSSYILEVFKQKL